MTGPIRQHGSDWEDRGRELGETLRTYHAIVVTGIDPVATGQVAIGIGRAQCMYRRVAVADLFADSPPIQALVTSDDPHGLVDSFVYGVSLSRIAYPVAGVGQLFVIQSGTEPPDYDELFANPRWHRLTAGFSEVGALLILAVPAGATRIEKLVDATDGAVLVGEDVPRELPVAKVITSLRATPDSPLDSRADDAHAAIADLAAEMESEPEPEKRRSKKRLASIAGVVLTVVLVALGVWLAYRPLAEGGRRHVGAKPPEAKGPLTAVTMTPPDSASRAASAAPGIPVVHNPEDSAGAALFAVEVTETNTQAGAILKLAKDGTSLPAATFAPVLRQGARWFNVISGAYASRAEADSLLAALRARKVLDPGNGAVVRLPYAFFIDSVPATAVAGMVKAYADRGIPVYALKQPNGTAWLLAGAFESPESSSLHAESLRASAITPVLVYRKGRTF